MHNCLTATVITDPSAAWTSASHSVQLLEIEPQPSPLLVLGCGTVCQQTLLRVTHFHSSAENLKHFCLGSFIRLGLFSLWSFAVVQRFTSPKGH